MGLLSGRELPAVRQESLQRTLEAASKQMGPEERARPGPGPPPLLALIRPLPLPFALQPHTLQQSARPLSGGEDVELEQGNQGPFIYNPRAEAGKERERAAQPAPLARWVCNEPATVEVEIRNPTSTSIKACPRARGNARF